MSAIAASSARCKTMADGTLQLTVNIEPTDAIKAFTLFSAPGTALAIAALVPDHKRAPEPETEPEPIKGGQIARWLGIRCGEAEFTQWLADQWPKQFAEAHGSSPREWAASCIRAVCCVESRAEFDNDIEAERRFHKRIREPWVAHQQSRGEE